MNTCEENVYPTVPSELRRKANDNALMFYGKSTIFEDRARRYHNRLTVFKILGITAPLLMYGLIASFRLSDAIVSVAIGITSLISTILLMVSVWSMAANWELQYINSLQAQNENARLYRLYKELGQKTLLCSKEYQNEIDKLDLLADRVESTNMRLGISEAEKRFGMRAGLREFQRRCVECKEIPEDLSPTDCGVCGRYKKRRWF